MKKCPYCGEEIKDEAIKCKHCGEWLNKGDKLTEDITRGSKKSEENKLTENIKRGSQYQKEDNIVNKLIKLAINFVLIFFIIGLSSGASEDTSIIALIFIFIFSFLIAFLFPFTSIKKNFNNFILNFRNFKKLKIRYIVFIIFSFIFVGSWLNNLYHETYKPIVHLKNNIKLDKIIKEFTYTITGENIEKIIINGKEYKIKNNKLDYLVDLSDYPEKKLNIQIIGKNGDKINKTILVSRPKFDYEKILPEVKILSSTNLNKIILTGYELKLKFKNTLGFKLNNKDYQIPTTGEYLWTGNINLEKFETKINIQAYNKYNKINKDFIIKRPLTKQEQEIERLKKLKPEIKVLTNTNLDFPKDVIALNINFKNTDYFTINGEKYDKKSMGSGIVVFNKNNELEVIKSNIPLDGLKTNIKVVAYNKYNKTEKNIIVTSPDIIREEAEEKIKNQFSPWDGSHIILVKILKENYLKDPDSFKHMETRYSLSWNKNSKKWYVSVIMKYRAKNSFGGYVINTVKAYFDLEGNPIKLNKWKNF